MRPRHAAFFFAITGLSLLAACDQKPESFEECLVELGKGRPAQEASQLCRAAFPAEKPFYVGSFYYPTGEYSECLEIAFDDSGETVSGSRGPCGYGSRIECTDTGACYLACSEYAGTDSTAVWSIELREGSEYNTHGDVLLLGGEQPDDTTAQSFRALFYEHLSACEQQRREQRRLRDRLEEARTDTAGND